MPMYMYTYYKRAQRTVGKCSSSLPAAPLSASAETPRRAKRRSSPKKSTRKIRQ